MMNEAERAHTLKQMRFAPELEQTFQQDYYRKLLPGLRGGLLMLVALHLLLMFSWGELRGGLTDNRFLGFIVVGSLILGCTAFPQFQRFWQPVVVVLFCSLAYLMLRGILEGRAAPPTFSPALGSAPLGPPPGAPSPGGPGGEGGSSNPMMGPAIPILVFGFVLTRLQFRWFIPGSLAVFALTLWAATTATQRPIQEVLPSGMLSVGSPLAALMFISYVQERTARGEFLANYLLDLERQDERRKRERTEAMLKVLSQATGGIVHDLGNPLTSVQTGVGTLESFLEDGCTDRELLHEFVQIAQEGTEMLNYLRLSLMEEVRVLEGRPIPVELTPTCLRPIIEAGARYQKVSFSSGREVTLEGDELELTADGMRLTTVFMNLIGNALKYSDGEIRVAWHIHQGRLLAAVLDRGKEGKGITREQAAQLFVPFGRLETHAQIEGTGLGLLSAQRTVEAHHGTLFIEGYQDGTPDSERFATTSEKYPSVLCDGFRTAFVVACPLAA